jgi:hypothetical protein
MNFWQHNSFQCHVASMVMVPWKKMQWNQVQGMARKGCSHIIKEKSDDFGVHHMQ